MIPVDDEKAVQGKAQRNNGQRVPLSELIICIAKRVVKKKAACQHELSTLAKRHMRDFENVGKRRPQFS